MEREKKRKKEEDASAEGEVGGAGGVDLIVLRDCGLNCVSHGSRKSFYDRATEC